jgi:outer membrane protein
MNRFVVGIAALVALLGTGVAEAEAQGAQRLGYINSQRIMAEAPGTSEAQTAFERDMETYRAELERLETELDTLQQSLERQQATLSAAARQERQQEIQQRFMAYQQRQAELEQQAQQRQAELVSPIMQRISVVIEEIRVEGGYALIFDAATGALITADPALDLTDQVLERLRTTAQ